mmetsp:Transcript_35118/g.91890  ORF Transcript_35118/g.91890 Transcript_35118/m.91890 type:complete len:201 (-) Transcript_35118:411-1013(-)
MNHHGGHRSGPVSLHQLLHCVLQSGSCVIHLIDHQNSLAADESAKCARRLIKPLLQKHFVIGRVCRVVVELERHGEDGDSHLRSEHSRRDKTAAANGHDDIRIELLDGGGCPCHRLGDLGVAVESLPLHQALQFICIQGYRSWGRRYWGCNSWGCRSWGCRTWGALCRVLFCSSFFRLVYGDHYIQFVLDYRQRRGFCGE